MVDKTNDIIQIINSYTAQIERYENLSTWYAAFSIVCVMVVAMTAITLIIKQKEEEDTNRAFYNGVLSCIFLIIPSVITLYLYVFAMNMRKVALYRGYLGFLEKQWNSLSGLNIMLFDDEIINNFYSFPNFLVNGLGPIVMAIFIILSIIIGFGLSIHFIRQLKNSRIKTALRLLVCILMIICVLFNGLCTYYLSTNESVTESVINYCEKQ